MGSFEWPWQYSFPPFFTIQPNAATREKQVDVWCQLIQDYFRYNRQFKLNTHESASSSLFKNASINRKLSLDSIEQVLNELNKRNRLEWIDKKKGSCYVYWTRPEELADSILRWIEETGRSNTVCTFVEITDESNGDHDFINLDREVLVKALGVLEARGKAEIMNFDGHEGVKFF